MIMLVDKTFNRRNITKNRQKQQKISYNGKLLKNERRMWRNLSTTSEIRNEREHIHQQENSVIDMILYVKNKIENRVREREKKERNKKKEKKLELELVIFLTAQSKKLKSLYLYVKNIKMKISKHKLVLKYDFFNDLK